MADDWPAFVIFVRSRTKLFVSRLRLSAPVCYDQNHYAIARTALVSGMLSRPFNASGDCCVDGVRPHNRPALLYRYPWYRCAHTERVCSARPVPGRHTSLTEPRRVCCMSPTRAPTFRGFFFAQLEARRCPQQRLKILVSCPPCSQGGILLHFWVSVLPKSSK
jgi:hypothetical protein